MIASFPPYGHREPMDVFKTSVAIALIFTPVLVKFHLDHRQQQAVTGEYESSKSSILSMIDVAADQQDLKTLTRINDKYGRCVSDGSFQSAIRDAWAKVAAHEAELELDVSRHLDLMRHQEESSLGVDLLKPQISPEAKGGEQPLSRLPR